MFNSTMQRVSAATAAVVLVATGTGTALASPAKATVVKPFVNNRIVTQQSIGGFAIGESPAAVKKHFAKKSCTASDCQYTGAGYTATVQFGVKVNSKKATVNYVVLTSTTGKDTATKVRTASGVGLGSSYAKAKKGLPHAKYYGNKKSGYFFIGKGQLHTVGTIVYITNGAVNQIAVQRVDHVG